MKRHIYKALRWQISCQSIAAVLNFIQLFVLIQFLSAEDFGYIAIANAILAFALQVLDLGVDDAIVQQKTVRADQLSTLFYLIVVFAGIMAGLIWCLGPWIATYFGTPVLSDILPYTAIIILLSSIQVIPQAMLRRHIQFHQLGKIQLLSASMTLPAAIYCAYITRTYHALIVAGVINSSISSILTVWSGRRYWKLTPSFVLSSSRSFIEFGFWQIGERLGWLIKNHSDNLIIGKLLGAEVLGVYDVIKRLLGKPFDLIVNGVWYVYFTVLSRIHQKWKLFSRLATNITLNTAVGLVPFYLLVIAYLDIIGKPLLGETYANYGHLFAAFSMLFIIRIFYQPIGVLLLTRGHANLSFKWSLLSAGVLLFATLLGASINIVCVVYLQFIAYALLIASLFVRNQKYMGWDLIYSIRDLAIIFTVAILSVWISRWIATLTVLHWTVELIVGCALFFLIYIFSMQAVQRKRLLHVLNIINSSKYYRNAS